MVVSNPQGLTASEEVDNCFRAITSASTKLSIDPGTLVEWLRGLIRNGLGRERGSLRHVWRLVGRSVSSPSGSAVMRLRPSDRYSASNTAALGVLRSGY